MTPIKGQEHLLRIIKEISGGKYTDDIQELTGPGYPPEIQELAEAVGLMMVQIEAREFHLEQLYEKIKTTSLNTVTAVASALGARDTYTEGHGDRVGIYAERLARRIRLPEDEVERIRIAGTLHDIGKIGFSDTIFSNEETRLNGDMMLEIRCHPQWGHDILKDLDFLGASLDYVYSHHERLDGKGYPRGLTADEIPMGARILAVADCFDAMTTDRSYQKGKTPQDAFTILGELAGPSLDPDLVEAFIDEIENNGMAD